MKLFHGTHVDIAKFEIQRENPNGTEFGFGIYFAETLEEASKYGDKVYEVEFDLGKSLEDTKITLTRNEVRKIIEDIQEDTDHLSDYGYVPDMGYENVMAMAVDNYMDLNSDTDILGSMIGATDAKIQVVEAVGRLGYTHNVGSYPNGVRVWVVYDPSKLTIVKTHKV